MEKYITRAGIVICHTFSLGHISLSVFFSLWRKWRLTKTLANEEFNLWSHVIATKWMRKANNTVFQPFHLAMECCAVAVINYILISFFSTASESTSLLNVLLGEDLWQICYSRHKLQVFQCNLSVSLRLTRMFVKPNTMVCNLLKSFTSELMYMYILCIHIYTVFFFKGVIPSPKRLKLSVFMFCPRSIPGLSSAFISTSSFSCSVYWTVYDFLYFPVLNRQMRSNFSLTNGLYILLLPLQFVICSIHISNGWASE